jgi:hypothetical protein
VAASSIMSITLIYYYCPSASLANSVPQLQPPAQQPHSQHVWQTDNDVAANTYSVEFSRNGVDFT